ncbi:MAG: YbaK/EbsC family protein [Chloroflexi bacterium]|nr:YbaK/EbsC family protein [Chloroflexota bacterium]
MRAVIMEAAGRPVMVVIPAHAHVDTQKVAATLGVERAHIAGDDAYTQVFRDCEAGAIPPFGNLYGLPVYVDAGFLWVHTVVFPAGRRTRSVTMPYREYVRLVRPVVADLVMTSPTQG